MSMADPYNNMDRFHHTIPDGDDHERMVCKDCGFIAYENPKIIAGAVVTYGDKFLLCKRAIYPQNGKWTIPAGFLEMGERPMDGAKREVWEEARADVRIKDLLAVYTVTRISQVHMMYRAVLDEPRFEPGPESEDVALVTWDEIPWEELAFPSVHWVLTHFKEAENQENFAPFSNPAGWEMV